MADPGRAEDGAPARPSILGSSSLVTLLGVGISLISFLNQLLIARAFGVSEQLTAYQVAVSGPAFVASLLAASLSFSMVPLLVRRRLEDPLADRFGGAITARLLVACLGLSLFGVVASDPLVAYLGRSLSPPALDVARHVGRVSWTTVSLTVLLAQLTAIHNSVHRFVVPMLASSGPYFGMVLGALVLGPSQGVLSIAYGLLVGTLVAVLFLGVRTRGLVCLRRPTAEQTRTIAAFFGQLPAIVVSSSIFIAFQFIDAYWAPQVSVSSLPTLGFAQRLVVAFAGVVTSGPSAIMSPRLAEAIAADREADFIRDAGRILRTTLGFGGYVAGMVSVLATPLVRLLFQRGRFDATATSQLAGALPWMMAGMVFMACIVMLFGAFHARKSIAPTVRISLGTVGGYFALSGVLSRAFGTQGIAAAYAAVWLGAFVAAVPTLWQGHRRELLGKENGRFVVALLLSLAGSCAVAGLGARLLLRGEAMGGLPTAASLLVCGALGLLAFYLSTVRVFHLRDIEVVFDFFGRLLGRVSKTRLPRAKAP